MKKPTAALMSLLLTASLTICMPTSAMAAEHTPPLSSSSYPQSFLYQDSAYFPSDKTVWDLSQKQPVLKDSGVNKFVWAQVYSKEPYYSAIYKDSDNPSSNTVKLTGSQDQAKSTTTELNNVKSVSAWYVLYNNGDFAIPGKSDSLLHNVKCWQTIGDDGYLNAVHGALSAVLDNDGNLYVKYEDYPDSQFEKIDTGVTNLGSNCYEKNGVFYIFQFNKNGGDSDYTITSSKLDCPSGTSKCLYAKGSYYYESSGQTYWHGSVLTSTAGSGTWTNQTVLVSDSGLDSVSPSGDLYWDLNTPEKDGTVLVRTANGHIYSVWVNALVSGQTEPYKVLDFGTGTWPDSSSEAKIAFQNGNQDYNSNGEAFSPSLPSNVSTISMSDIKNYFEDGNSYLIQRTDNTLWKVYYSTDSDNKVTPGTPYQLDFAFSGKQSKTISGFSALSESVKSRTAAYGTTLTSLNLPTSLDATVDGVQTSISGITWTSKPTYQSTSAGTYTFTAVLPDGYSLDDGVSLPQIIVIVSAASSGSGSGSSGGGSSSGSSSSGSSSTTEPTPQAPTATYTSDTTHDFSVNNNYQFKITSKDGTAPKFIVGTAGVFDVQLAKVSGSDYYFKLTAIGAPGEKAGIYVNGQRLLVATVGTNTTYTKLDTGKQLSVKSGKTYQFKITATKKPTFICGSGNIFRVSYAGTKGNDYFFKVIAIGKARGCAGFYVNHEKTPRTIGTIA